MAWGLSIEASIRVRDSKGAESDIKFNHPVNTDIGALKQTLRSTAQLIDSVIRGQVVGCTITLVVNLPANLNLKLTAVAGADVEEGVRFTFSTGVGSQTLFRIPTMSETWLNNAGGLVYAANDAVDQFIQRIIQGRQQGLISASPSDAYGNDISAFVGGQEAFGTSRG